MIWSMATERCTTIHLEITLKDNGKKTWNQEWELWTGLTFVRNMLEIGKIISKKVGVFTFGSNQKVKESLWEIAMKVSGKEVFVKDLEFFIMQTDQNTKDIGRITWRKATLSIQTKMARFPWFSSRKIEWSKEIDLIILKKMWKKQLIKRKFNPIFITYASTLSTFIFLILLILSFYATIY